MISLNVIALCWSIGILTFMLGMIVQWMIHGDNDFPSGTAIGCAMLGAIVGWFTALAYLIWALA